MTRWKITATVVVNRGTIFEDCFEEEFDSFLYETRDEARMNMLRYKATAMEAGFDSLWIKEVEV